MKRSAYLLTLATLVVFGCAEDAALGDEPRPDLSIQDAAMIQGDSGPIADAALPPADQGLRDAASDAAAVTDMSLAGDIGADASVDAGLAACDPALALTASATAARPFDLIRLRPSGGTGAWRFSLEANESGGLLNETTGAYLAGELSGTTDRILLVDEGCIGEAHYDVRVVNSMSVHPSRAEVEREQSFQFRIDEGSGEFAFELVAARSGGQISEDGLYTAGPVSASDLVRVRDVQTGQSRDVIINVVNRVVLTPSPAQLFIPVGSTAEMVVDGGTGEFDVAASGPGVIVEGAQIRAVSSGRFELDITDAFIGIQTRMVVHVVGSLNANLQPFDDAATALRTVSAGDLNGDGVDDFVIAYSSADVEAGNSGAVFVYHSEPGGFGADPAQIFSGTSVDEDFGRDVAFGDLNDDGLTDMVVGARLADPGMNDAGALFVHLGEPGGTFSEAPVDVLSGVRGGDQLGFSVTVCDFNGDGRLDIAGGAIAYEDRTQQPIAFTQGAAMIFLGYEDGFLAEPDQILTGLRRENDGSWTDYRDLQFGSELVSGDMDGDGRCELVAGVNRYRVNGVNNQGVVYIYRGVAPDQLSPGGVTLRPSKMIQDDGVMDNGNAFGRRLHMADMNGDQLGDVIVGAHATDTGGRDRGAAYIFLGGAFAGDEAMMATSTLTADGFYPGDSNYDNDGIGVTVGDVTGDGLPDLVVGGYSDDPPGRGNAGRITIYAGRPDDVPAAELTREIDAPIANMRMGEAVVIVGDVNADGLNDIIAHASRDSSLHHEAGRTYLITRGPEPPPEEGEDLPEPAMDAGAPEEPPIVDLFTPIDFPRRVGAGRFGQGVSLVGDVTGDGIEDVVVAASFVATNAIRSGGAWLYPGGADGVNPEGQFLGGYPNHSASDLTWSATGIGDFDGDGHNDFAVLVRDDERPTDRDLGNAPWAAPDEACMPRGYNTGGVYVFLGGGDGAMQPSPSFAYYEGASGLSPEKISGGFDFDGDGLGDIVVGGYRWDPDGRNNAGATYVITGRAFTAEADRIQVICDTYYRYEGSQAGMESGRAVTALGDLNGDGCDEFATGSRLEDREVAQDEGGVRILYGFGAEGCPPGPRMLRMATAERSSQTGWSLASGDFDDDGIPDLAVGAWQRRSENIPVGGAWVVPGSYLSGQAPRSIGLGDSEEPLLLNQWGSEWLVTGQVRDAQAGYSVAFAGPFLAVGAPQAPSSGVVRAGMVRIYRVRPDGIDAEPVAIMVGETVRPNGRAGYELSGGMLDGQPVFVVSSLFGNGTGLDNGSAYVLRLDAIGD